MRNFVNRISGSTRCLGHGLMYTGIGNTDYIQFQIDNYHPDAWKGYCISNAAKVDKDPESLMRQWRLDDEIIDHAVRSTEQTIEHLNEAKLPKGPINIEAEYDEVYLEIVIEYKGTLLALPAVGARHKHYVEEEAFVHGIKDFLTGVYPDRIETSSKHDDAKIRLFFNV